MDTWLDDPEDNEREGEERSKMAAFYICIALVPLFFFIDHLGTYDLAMNICFCLFVNAAVIRTRWKLRNYVWFWVVMVLIVVLELPIAFTVRWPSRQWVPAVALLPIAFAGYLFAMGVVKLVEHFMVKDSPSDQDQ